MRNKSKCSRLNDLALMTSQEDAYLFVDSILSIHPDCKQAMLKYLYNSTDSFPFSMFIMKRELFEEYCEFIFPALFDLEKRIKTHGYSRQQRTLGYFGEFSLGLFIFYKNLKVKNGELIGTGAFIGGYKRKVLKYFRNLLLYRIPEMFVPVPNDINLPDVIKTGLNNDGIRLKYLT